MENEPIDLSLMIEEDIPASYGWRDERESWDPEDLAQEWDTADQDGRDVLTEWCPEEPFAAAEPFTALMARVQRGDDERAFRLLLGQYTGLLRHYARKNPAPELPYHDRLQHGLIGFWQAAERFTIDDHEEIDDLDARKMFTSYAGRYIEGYIKRANANSNSTGLSVSEYWKVVKLSRAEDNLLNQLARHPSEEELAAALQWPVERVAELRPYTRRAVSLDEPYTIEKNGKSETLLDRLAGSHNVADASLKNLDRERVRAAITQLPKDLANVVYVSFGIPTGEQLAVRKVAEILGISRQTVLNRKNEAQKMLAELLRDCFELDESEAAG